jgi:hypothetical protein
LLDAIRAIGYRVPEINAGFRVLEIKEDCLASSPAAHLWQQASFDNETRANAAAMMMVVILLRRIPALSPVVVDRLQQ